LQISGKNINLRTVVVEDAEFIFTLRNNVQKAQYLSQVNGTVEDQRRWIEKYKEREINNEEYYFVIESKNQESLGLVRMYDFQKQSFSWGSWLIKDCAPKTTAIESALQVYETAFHKLQFTQSHFEVQKGNLKVIAFHKRFGAEIVDENDEEYFFIMKQEVYNKTKQRYKRYL